MSEKIKEEKHGYVSKWENRQKRWQLQEAQERGEKIKEEEDELGTLDRLKEKENDRRRTSERE